MRSYFNVRWLNILIIYYTCAIAKTRFAAVVLTDVYIILLYYITCVSIRARRRPRYWGRKFISRNSGEFYGRGTPLFRQKRTFPFFAKFRIRVYSLVCRRPNWMIRARLDGSVRWRRWRRRWQTNDSVWTDDCEETAQSGSGRTTRQWAAGEMGFRMIPSVMARAGKETNNNFYTKEDGLVSHGVGGRDTRIYGRQEVVFKWITVPPPTRLGEKRACDNLTDGVGDYPAMRNIRAKKTGSGGCGKSQKETARACINVINNNSSERKTCAAYVCTGPPSASSSPINNNNNNIVYDIFTPPNIIIT